MFLIHLASLPHEVMVTPSLTHNSNVLLIFLALKLYILTVTIPLTAYLLLLHITHHVLTFLTSYVNIFIYYFPLNAAGKFLSTHPSSLTDVLRDILVKAKLPTITTPNSNSLPPGSSRCGQDCATCPYITLVQPVKSSYT